jgi:putative oxidoreductase
VAVTVHMKNGFFAQNSGYEYAIVLGVAALGVALTGPGTFSLDALFGNHLSGTLWGIAASFVGVLGGAFSLIQRHETSAQQTESLINS